MNFAAKVNGFEIFCHVFRHQMAAVAGRVDQHIVSWPGQRTIQRGLEASVTGLMLGKAQIIDKNNEAISGDSERKTTVPSVSFHVQRFAAPCSGG